MPALDLPNGTHLHYHVEGAGPALLALAPGGLFSRRELWAIREDGRPRGSVDPRQAFVDRFTVITVDQRNAGQSHAAITARDGWRDYAEDNLLLLDALGIERFHVLGACIGPSFALKIIDIAPARVLSAVLQQPIGRAEGNAHLRSESFAKWAAALSEQGRELNPQALSALEHNLFSGDFVYSVSRAFVQACRTPLLVLPGDDARHPREVALELARLAPKATLFEGWQTAAGQARYREVLEDFFNQQPIAQGQPHP